MDNCEHLIKACAQLADALLRGAPDLTILATSRESLRLAGESIYRVPSLYTPLAEQLSLEALAQFDAIKLFVVRAQSVRSEFALTTANAPALAQICQRLDGIPLAIELAAARIKLFSPDQIAARLDACFRLLTGGSRTALPRQQTLSSAIDWSYGLLSESERILLRRLAVFAGGWLFDAAEAVTVDDGRPATRAATPSIGGAFVLDSLSALVDKSLVIAEERGDETRYRLLETIRQYALDKLREANEIQGTRDRHLDFFTALAEIAFVKLYSPEHTAWLDKLESENDNLRAAIDWAIESGRADVGLRLMRGISPFLRWRGYHREGRAHLLALLARPEALGHTAARAQGLADAASSSGFLGLRDQALALADEAIATAREANELTIVSHGLWVKGVFTSDSPSRLELFDQALAAARAADWKFGIGSALGSIGSTALALGDTRLARGNFEQAIALLRGLGTKASANYWMIHLGTLYYLQGDYVRAQSLLQEALALARQVRGRLGKAWALHRLGAVAMIYGDYDAAGSLWQESLQVSHELGFKREIATVLKSQSDLARARADLAAAAALAQASLEIARELQALLAEAQALASLGQIALASGDFAAARSHLVQSLALREQGKAILDLPPALQLLGDVEFLQGSDEQARANYEKSLALAREMELHPLISLSQRLLGYLELRAGAVERATEFLLPSFQFNIERKLTLGIAPGLVSFAALALASGGPRRALAPQMLGASQALLESVHAQLEPPDAAEYKRSVAMAQSQLDQAPFQTAWNEGTSLTQEQAITLALEFRA